MAEEDSQVLREVGERPSFGFTPRDATELGSKRGWIDMKRGARLSGSRFAYRIGDVAMTELALYRFVLQAGGPRLPAGAATGARGRAGHVRHWVPAHRGVQPLPPGKGRPVPDRHVRGRAGRHPRRTQPALYEADLPALYAGYTTNFRREAGAAGKDTKGMFRVHQFDKVEMYVDRLPGQSAEFHERLLGYEEEIVTCAPGLPYRVMNIAVADPGVSAARSMHPALYPSSGTGDHPPT